MAGKKQRGSIDGGFGRGIPISENENQAEDEEVVVDDDVEEFFEADEGSERRRDPLRRPV